MNNFGTKYRIKIYGGSHEPVVGIIISGCPSGINIKSELFEKDIDRRRPLTKGTTPRKEEDKPNILVGVKDDLTTGEEIRIEFLNKNFKPEDYDKFNDHPRPGHADHTQKIKYGTDKVISGGGQSSGRMTLPLVAAGIIAKEIIKPIEIKAKIIEAGGKTEYKQLIDEIIKSGDSIGGVIECRAKNVPAGLGEPFFNSVESQLSKLLFSIPGIKGIEFGDFETDREYFKSSKMRGSEHNDLIIDPQGRTETNFSGGINGGITNGNDICFRVAVKPASSIRTPQKTYNFKTGQIEELAIKGRHDAFFAARIPVIIAK